jgi:hypothetical protein
MKAIFFKKVDYFSACITVFSIQMDSINCFESECSLCSPDSVDLRKVFLWLQYYSICYKSNYVVRFSALSGLGTYFC